MSEVVKKGDKIKIEYTGKLEDGTVFDTSDGRDPLAFEAGAGQVIPGFDKAVDGMKKDEEKTFTIKSEDANGSVKEELVQEIPRDKLPEKPEPAVGMMLVMKSPDGRQMPAKITKVEADKITLDVNHPLAGKDLTFTVKVVGINEPEAEKKEEKSVEDKEGSDEKKKDEEETGCDSCDSCPGCH